MAVTRRGVNESTGAAVSHKDISGIKAKEAQEAQEEPYKANIVYLKTDPHRAAIIEKRRYEMANPDSVDWSKRMPHRGHDDFGGAWGVTSILIFSHCLIWYFTLSLQTNSGFLILPKSLDELFSGAFFSHILDLWRTHSTPTVKTCVWYWSFLLIQGIFAVTLPGIIRLGEPLPSLKGKQLPYICNAIAAFWVTFTSFALAHYYGLFDYTQIVDNIAPLATTIMLTADTIALFIYFNVFGTGQPDPDISGNPFYDYFMGVCLNPRVGPLDIKMFFEVRVSWIMMAMVTTSAALKFYLTHGYLSNNILLISIGQLIYCYSVMKGEHLILPTWDISCELYGAMLCYWNSCLPILYSAQSLYILNQNPADIAIPDWVFYAMLTWMLIAYYCFDTTNSQKNTFRQMYNGSFEPRPWAIPSFAYGTLENPRYLITKAGTPLLIDGWYAYAKKWHYTSDIAIGLVWCLSAGFNTAFIPKFYLLFFLGMLFHRNQRDVYKMSRKYGKDWEAYCKEVPWVFIPGVY